MTSQVLRDHAHSTFTVPVLSTQLSSSCSQCQPYPLGFSDCTLLPLSYRPLTNTVPLARNLVPLAFAKHTPPSKIFILLYSNDPFSALASARGGKNWASLSPWDVPGI